MEFDKFRLRFCKAGSLRLVSHHDLMRVFERMLRRAQLPFRSTSGFHPHPRIVFALSLPLGVEGLDEIVEIEMTQPMPADEILQRLNRQAPDGLRFTSIERIPPNVTAQVGRATYAIDLPSGRETALLDRCRALLAQSECRVQRGHPQPRSVDIRPYLIDLRIADGRLVMDFLVTPNGTARADEVLGVLDARDLLDGGAALQRTHLQLHNETIFDRSSDALHQRQEAIVEADCVATE